MATSECLWGLHVDPLKGYKHSKPRHTYNALLLMKQEECDFWTAACLPLQSFKEEGRRYEKVKKSPQRCYSVRLYLLMSACSFRPIRYSIVAAAVANHISQRSDSQQCQQCCFSSRLHLAPCFFMLFGCKQCAASGLHEHGRRNTLQNPLWRSCPTQAGYQGFMS